MQASHASTRGRMLATSLSALLMLSIAVSSFTQGPSRPAPAFEKGNYLVRTTDGIEVHGQLERMDDESLTIYQRPRVALAPTRGGVTVSYRVPLRGR